MFHARSKAAMPSSVSCERCDRDRETDERIRDDKYTIPAQWSINAKLFWSWVAFLPRVLASPADTPTSSTCQRATGRRTPLCATPRHSRGQLLDPVRDTRPNDHVASLGA